jgi:hypothetical protein
MYTFTPLMFDPHDTHPPQGSSGRAAADGSTCISLMRDETKQTDI